MLFNFRCKKPEICNCSLSEKQQISLKSLASEIVFRLYNKNKFCFDNNITCKPLQIPEFQEYFFLF